MFVKFNCTFHKFKSGMRSYFYSHNQKSKFTEEAIRTIYGLEYDEDLSIEFDPKYICDKYEFFSCVQEFNAYFNNSKVYTPGNFEDPYDTGRGCVYFHRVGMHSFLVERVI